MKKIQITTIVFSLFLLFSCNDKAKTETTEISNLDMFLKNNDVKLASTKMYSELAYEDIKKTKRNDGLTLMKQNCYACHSITTKSHDDIIAPPMIAVKNRYKKEFDSKENFVQAFVDYASNPKEEKALMKGAVKKFKVMPKQSFVKADLIKIAIYVYDNEIETPEWFEDHFQQKHKMGNGKGNNISNNVFNYSI